MEKISYDAFGQFVQQLRKEKGLTQKQLAEKLSISDKAVSKWERGLGMPDIQLLMPLSRILGVTTTELLCARRMEQDAGMTVTEVESLMSRTLRLSEEEQRQRDKNRQTRRALFCLCVLATALELLFMTALGYTADDLAQNLLTVELLMGIFGAYFTFFTKETLPVYYDENRIGFYNDGIFRMNIPGIRFNNSNWPHILSAAHLAVMGIFVLFPLLYLAVSQISPALWEKGRLVFTLGAVFSMFIPIYAAGKKYE